MELSYLASRRMRITTPISITSLALPFPILSHTMRAANSKSTSSEVPVSSFNPEPTHPKA